MDFGGDPPETLITTTTRHKCAACFKKYNKKEHLIAHMKTAYHSVHQPKCGVCHKYCKSFESLREHTAGPLAKGNCSEIYAQRGCKFCMRIFDSILLLSEHQEICCIPAPTPLEILNMSSLESQIYNPPPENIDNGNGNNLEAIAIDCAMAGGGSDGTLDQCVKVCLVDEDGNPIFHTYVEPKIPVTNYRYEITGITEDHLRDAMPLKEVQHNILQILYNGESIGRLRVHGGRGRVLVGHGLQHDLHCLQMDYPDHLLRDTAKYPPLMKTNLKSHSLKYLVKTYLGYDIQSGLHDSYVDCVSVMRLYKFLRAQKHPAKVVKIPMAARSSHGLTNIYDSLNYKEVEEMTPDELFDISKPNYKCWCLDFPQG